MSDYSNALYMRCEDSLKSDTSIIMNDVTWNYCLGLTCKLIFLFIIDCFIQQLRLLTLWAQISQFQIMLWNPYHEEKGQLISWRMSDLTIFAQLVLCRKYQVNACIFSSPYLFLYLVWKCHRVQGKTKGMSPGNTSVCELIS